MYCQSCGKDTPEQAVFCLHCGARINKECPRCAEIIKFRAKVCRFCGYKFILEEITTLEQDEQARLREIERERQESAMREKLQREIEQEEMKKRKKKEQEEEEYARWHRPDIVSKWGAVVLQCSECSTLNPVDIAQFPPKEFSECRRCRASLKSAARIKNPYAQS